MEQKLTDQEKKEMAEEIKQFLSEELEIDVDEIKDETNLIDDLGADSILFLEMFEEFSEKFGIKLEVRTIGRYMIKNPVYTFKETMDAMFYVIEKGESLIDELDNEEQMEGQKIA